MKIDLKALLDRLISLNFFLKRLILIFVDIIIIYFSVILSYWLRFDSFIIPSSYIILIFFITYFLSQIIFKTYNFSIRYLETEEYVKVTIKAALTQTLILFLISLLIYRYNFNTLSPGLPRSLPLIQPFLAFFLVLIFRVLINLFFNNSLIFKKKKEINTIIYSFDTISKNTINFMNREFNYRIEGIFFENAINAKYINRIPIINKEQLTNFVNKKKIKLIIVFLNDLAKINKDNLKRLSTNNTEVMYINSNLPVHRQIENLKNSDITNIITGLTKLSKVDTNKLFENFYNKTFLVTGAGGTIGSEICRQLLRYLPKKIILVDNSEYNLFQIYFQISQNLFYNEKNTQIISKLVDIQNDEAISQIFNENNKIDYVFHAAAFKHVGLGEKNKKYFAINNIKGTYVILKNIIKFKVNNFVNISTDKAVNPTTFMGKTKKFNEIMVKSMASDKNLNFSSVRFGNVLGSSGSVLSIFQNNILQNQPIQIFGKDTERYFMLTSEAVELVFGSLNLNLNGNVAVLNIAKPYKILEIARKVANFYNLEIDLESTNYHENKVPVIIKPLENYEKSSELLFNREKIISTEKIDYIIEEVNKIDIRNINSLCNQIENKFEENILDDYIK